MAAILPVQDQDVLVDWDRVQIPVVRLSQVWTGAEHATALDLPDGGRDLVLHCGGPEQTHVTD